MKYIPHFIMLILIAYGIALYVDDSKKDVLDQKTSQIIQEINAENNGEISSFMKADYNWPTSEIITSTPGFPTIDPAVDSYSDDESYEYTDSDDVYDDYEESYNDLYYDPYGPDVDCDDFYDQYDAQDFYEAAGGPYDDPHRLDGDDDGWACEYN